MNVRVGASPRRAPDIAQANGTTAGIVFASARRPDELADEKRYITGCCSGDCASIEEVSHGHPGHGYG